MIAAIALAGTVPFSPGEIITYEHGEGLVAGAAELNQTGYWMIDYSYGPVGQSPVDEERGAIIRDMLAGKRMKAAFTNNICHDGICAAAKIHTMKWRSKCEVRDTYAYRNMDAVRIEWECDGESDGFNIVDFENGIPVQVRDFGADRTIWVKDEN